MNITGQCLSSLWELTGLAGWGDVFRGGPGVLASQSFGGVQETLTLGTLVGAGRCFGGQNSSFLFPVPRKGALWRVLGLGKGKLAVKPPCERQ